MHRATTSIASALALTVFLAGCGDDDTEAAATTDAPATTAAPATTTPSGTEPPGSLPEPTGSGDLEAWCSGWIDGGVIDLPTVEEQEAAATANAIELNQVVPEEVREAWAAYTGGPSVPDDEFRQAYRVIDRFFLDNCDMVSIGTPITAAP